METESKTMLRNTHQHSHLCGNLNTPNFSITLKTRLPIMIESGSLRQDGYWHMAMKATSTVPLVARLSLWLAKLGLLWYVDIRTGQGYNMNTQGTTGRFVIVSTELRSDTLWILAKRPTLGTQVRTGNRRLPFFTFVEVMSHRWWYR